MTVTELMDECQQSGVTLGMDAQGGLSCRGDQVAVTRLLPTIRQHKPELIRLITGKPPAPPETDIQAMAQSIAREFDMSAVAVLGLLDDDDRAAIRTGSDPGRAEAWPEAVRSLVHRGEWQAAPKAVTCSGCRHATPAAPGLIDCEAKVSAPGAAGPFRWWATDMHVCGRYSETEVMK